MLSTSNQEQTKWNPGPQMYALKTMGVCYQLKHIQRGQYNTNQEFYTHQS